MSLLESRGREKRKRKKKKKIKEKRKIDEPIKKNLAGIQKKKKLYFALYKGEW